MTLPHKSQNTHFSSIQNVSKTCIATQWSLYQSLRKRDAEFHLVISIICCCAIFRFRTPAIVPVKIAVVRNHWFLPRGTTIIETGAFLNHSAFPISSLLRQCVPGFAVPTKKRPEALPSRPKVIPRQKSFTSNSEQAIQTPTKVARATQEPR